MKEKFKGIKREIFIYFVIIALSALAAGFSDGVFSNYFKDAYNISAFQRGLIEFPRELPGVLLIVIISLLAFLGDVRTAVISSLMSVVGVMVLGLVTPSFGVMLIFLFINSLGMHMLMPVQDGIGMALIGTENPGKRMGQYKGVSTGFTMIAGILVFVGVRTGFFDFTTKIKPIFIISAIISMITLILFIVLQKCIKTPIKTSRKTKIIFRKEYKYYYILAIMHGVQKQIMIVYGPWVLIEILNKKADTLALLGIVGAFIGIFFIPALGRWLDRFGIKKLLYVDALSFIGVYSIYGLLAGGFASGRLATVGAPVILIFAIFIIDKMSMQMGMIKVLYLRSIAIDPDEITPTLSLGISMDHIVSIICAYIGGMVWSAWGPQYIFFLAAGLSFINLFVASKVKNKEVEILNNTKLEV
ncbi:MAG: MFS transporter [Clostridium sp.]|uniref:MFS transporter n=1 Tax=Clostridium sp. TaxID=1506 RepID=UPI003023A666